MRIEILGPGCARCRTTEANVKKALAELNLEAEVSHIKDPLQFLSKGVRFTPGVIVDGKIMSSGRVPEVDEVKQWLSSKPGA